MLFKNFIQKILTTQIKLKDLDVLLINKNIFTSIKRKEILQ